MEICGNSYTIGADPELFAGINGTFVSAHNLIWGSKENPQVVNKGAVQVDGTALEFNIDPAKDLHTFLDNLSTVKKTLKGMIGECDFLEVSSVMFDEEFLESVPAFNRVLGCSSDFNGWTREENPSPDGMMLMRTAGGHVHVGGFPNDKEFEYSHYLRGARLARILDSTVGVYSVLWDHDDNRRDMYGAAGAFRPKLYGMEYRTLSNAWIFNEELMTFVYNGVEKALELFNDENHEPDPVVQQIINTSDRTHSFFKNNPTVKWLGL